MLDDDKFVVPKPQKIPDSDRVAPFVLLGDDAFGLKTYLMKPFPQGGLTDEKSVYNYRHCRARRISENLLGIILNRWCVLQAPILLSPESVKNVVIAILVLHNYLRQVHHIVPIAPVVLLMAKTQQDLHLGTGVKTKKHPIHSSNWVHSNFQEIHK